MLDKRIEFKGEYGISMRIEPSGEFTTAFVGVGGGFTTEYIDKIKESSDFWINIYKQLGKSEDEYDDYQDEQGCGLALDSLIYANKDYGIIAMLNADKTSIYMEMMCISADSKNLYMNTWNNSVSFDEGDAIWLDIVTEIDLLHHPEDIRHGEYIAVEVMRYKIDNLGKTFAGLVVSTLYAAQRDMNGIVPVGILTEEVISDSLQKSSNWWKNFPDNSHVSAQKPTIAVFKDVIPVEDINIKHGYLVSTVRYVDDKLSVDLLGLEQKAFNVDNFDFYIDGKIIDIKKEYEFFTKK